MNDAEVLKNFLVRLGWDVDRGGEARFKESVASATKSIAGLAAGLEAAAVAGALWVHKIASSFESIYYASGRIGASVQNINAFRYAVSQLGGSAEGAMASLEAFSRKMREGPGQEAFLKSWGVQTRDAAGRLRESTDLIRDMLSSQKFNAQPDFVRLRIAESMGIDERTYRALLQDVDRFTREYRAKLAAAGLDPDVAAKNAQKFEQSWRSMAQSFRMIGDQVATALAGKGGDKLQTFIDFLDKNSGKIARELVAIGEALAQIATWIAKAVIKFGEWAKEADPWIEKTFGIKNGFEKLAAVLLILYATRIPALISALSMLVGGPVWKALMIGLSVLGVGAAANAMLGNGGEGGGADGGGGGGGANKDSWYWKLDRWGRKKLGLPPDANDPAGKGPGGSGAGSAPSPEASGKYRPVYKLSDRDLGDAVVNTIAGEASYKRPGAVDAVINNMLNRVGSKGWGPSQDLHAVARAPGQYEGYKRAGAEEAEYIRERIRAIASGGVPDSTGGSNSFRASSYGGPWMQRHGVNGRNIGGNVYAYQPGFPNGPYAAYARPQPGSAMASPHTGQTPADMRGRVPPPLPGAGAPGAPSWAGGLAPVAPAAPLGGSFGLSGPRSVEINQTNSYSIDGAREPGATARAIAGMQSTTNSDMVRVMQGSAH